MPANGAIYIQYDTMVDLAELFEDVKSDKGLFRPPTFFDVRVGEDIIRFNVMDRNLVSAHIDRFLGYISSCIRDSETKEGVCHAIGHTRIVLGLITDKEFQDNPAIWESLFRIADRYDGFVFTYDSLLLPNGAVLFGPLLDDIH